MGQQAGGEPEALKHAQDSIETQLKEFGKDLWIYNDSTGVKKAIVEKPAKETKAKAGDETKRTNRRVKPKTSTPKTSKPKATKSQSDSGTRSVRRTP
ncbi:hypothetical protein FACS189413_13310 [Bacteroidia bacterium]|nr:hypothetical protein FACS189413_13310 [Bacteroidia bacterium]